METPALLYEVFAAAEGMRPEQRESYLCRVAAQHPGIASQVRALIERAPRALRFLDPGPAGEASERLRPPSAAGEDQEEAAELDAERHGDLAHGWLGSYRLLRKLGEGGMGVVYAAEQQAPVRRQVAIKLIKPGMDSRQVIARFEAERQALAMMEHPHIAKALEVGLTPQGRPYFVMEWVKGQPFNEYCRQQRLPLRTRLELLCRVCDAIQHAHNKGVVHRDVKPSNILITDTDEGPCVKVIDFGVAKALGQELTEKTLQTMPFQIVGTPLYASPEQWAMDGRGVDTRSDVYSIGVVLYEALCGALPFTRGTSDESDFETLRAKICALDPPRPSRRFEAEHRSKSGSHDASRSSGLARELDWIALKAIDREPARRYQSPRELAEDLRRYLAGEDVSAYPPSWRYRTFKAVRRHWQVLTTAAVVGLALIVGSLLALDQARKAEAARRRALANEDRAVRQAAVLNQLLYSRDMTAAAGEFLSGHESRFRELLARHVASGLDGGQPRGFEWQWFNGLQRVRREVVWQCAGRINVVAMAPDQTVVALGNSLGQIVLLAADDLVVQTILQAPHEDVLNLAFFGDRRLASCGAEGGVAIWDLPEALESQPALAAYVPVCAEPLSAMAVDVRGDRVYVGSDSGVLFGVTINGRDAIAETQTRFGRRINSLAAWDEQNLLVGLNCGELALAPTDRSGASALWSYRPEFRMNGIRDLAWDDQRRSVVCVHLRGLVTSWTPGPSPPQTSREQRLPQLKSKWLLPANLHCVATAGSGDFVVCGDALGKLHLLALSPDGSAHTVAADDSWDPPPTSWEAHRGRVEDLVLIEDSPESPRLLKVISVGKDGRVIASCPQSVAGIAYRPRPQRAPPRRVRLEAAGNRATLPDATAASAAPALLWKAAPGTHAVRVAMSPDEQHFAVCVEIEDPRRHILELRNYPHGDLLAQWDWNSVNDMEFSPNGQILAAVRNNDVFLIDVHARRQSQRLTGHRDSVNDIEFSPDGKDLASVSNDEQLIVWDAEAGKMRWRQQAHARRATAIAFDPVRPTIVTAGDDAKVRFWRAERDGVVDAARPVGQFPLGVGTTHAVWFANEGRELVLSHGGYGQSILALEDGPETPGTP